VFRIWAVARHMISDSIRQKIALLGIVLVLVILAVLPFTVEGDGVTLTSRVQSFLAYTLGSVTFVLSVVTVFLACLALSDEISKKSIFLVATKPIPRWQFFAGKWLGISVLNAMLLLVSAVAIIAAVKYLGARPTTVPGDRETMQFEVLNVRHGQQLKAPEFTAEIEQWIRQQREQGRLDEISARGEAGVREERREMLQKSWRSIGPNQTRTFEFSIPDVAIDREKEGWLHLRFKPTHAGGLSELMFQAYVVCGDPAEPETLTPEAFAEYPVDRFATMPIPSYAVNSKGVLMIWMRNLDPQYSITFEGNDSFELLYGVGTFHWNLFRAVCIIWCRLAFLALVGLLLSSFLSFPVACMGAFLVLIVGSMTGFLGTAVEWTDPTRTFANEPGFWIVWSGLEYLARGFMWLVPDFSKYDPGGNVVAGRIVTLNWVLYSLIVLVLVKGLIVGVLGSVILTRRELAQVTS